MALCSTLSTADALVLGAIQILIGIFHVFMWYFLLIMYMGQIKGVFGTYEPLTYKTGCPLWGIIFIISGIFLIKIARNPTPHQVACALILHIFCIIVTVIGVALTILELSRFDSVSYRNYGQAKLGREVSRILLFSYSLESTIAFTYCIFGCVDLGRSNEDGLSTVTVEAESSF
ncbi:membrane-spanning 4-domains subfamily A member 13 [Sturnira hondurensis]|uniref:membrane-spanning 4-domains subfamily A member 13 n=1 Tax=Sturnira hondurensis TaxID=192404 RepID=UPI0018799D5A|nr:membrane-spanning 4-domains subfamily A member 13 [Sturnira hondurensis]XP_036916328.1 membrane-spanning 4-domains subfamily A member 13 [Sturnira hondurensis]